MATVKKNRLTAVNADYDKNVDVLYVGRGERVPAEGEGLPGGVELDYALADGSPCGATVIGYCRNGWPNRLEQLARIVAGHLSVATNRVEEAIQAAVASG